MGEDSRRWTPWLAAGALAGAAAVAGAAFARRCDLHVRMCSDGLAVVRTVLDDEGAPLRVLSVGGAYQSAMYLDGRWDVPAFEYYRSFDRMFEAQHAEKPLIIRNVLMIGGGGCSYPKHLVRSREDVRIDVVEKDPVIARIARDFFCVDCLERALGEAGQSARFGLIVADGVDYLEQSCATYDAVINDAFSGRVAESALLTEEALGAAKSRLCEGGLYLMNVVAGDSLQDAQRLHGVVDALRGVFAYVSVVDATDDIHGGASNYLVIATDGVYEFSDVIPW